METITLEPLNNGHIRGGNHFAVSREVVLSSEVKLYQYNRGWGCGHTGQWWPFTTTTPANLTTITHSK